jgi:hypothetical protein
MTALDETPSHLFDIFLYAAPFGRNPLQANHCNSIL